MSPEALHVPPRPPAASASASARPPVAAMVFNLLLVKKPMRLLSGDQNGSAALSPPSRRFAPTSPRDRTHSWPSERDTAPTTNTTIVPSGEIATPLESGYSTSPDGGSTERRVSAPTVGTAVFGHNA